MDAAAMAHGSQTFLRIILACATLTIAGCAGLRELPIVQRWNRPADAGVQAASREVPVDRAAAQADHEQNTGFFAKILPASWFVADDVPDEHERARAKAKVHYSLGQVYEKKQALRQAEEAYENALRADPQFVPALLALARVYQQTGRPDAALELYEQLIELAPNNPSVWNDMGLCYQNLGDLVQAEQCLRKAIALDPMRDLYRNNLAYVLASMGYYDQAWEEFRRAVGPVLAHYNLALVARELGDHATAIKHATEALALDGGLEPARELLRQLQNPTQPEQGEPPSRLDLPQDQTSASDRPAAPAVRVLAIRPER